MKKNQLMTSLCGLVLSSIAGTAVAAQGSGFYVKGELGKSWANSASVNNNNDGAVNPMLNGSLGVKGDATVKSFAVGYDFNIVRLDVSYTDRNNYSISGSDQFPGSSLLSYSGDVNSSSWMLNVYKDFSVANFKPFIGVGVGQSTNKVDSFSFTENGVKNTLQGGSRTDMAKQLVVGVGYALSPNAIVELSYNYIDLGSFKTDRGDAKPVYAGFDFSGVKGDITAQETKIALRYKF